jgi:trigger factor
MKTDLVDVNETRKDLRVEIPSDIVDAHIARVAQHYSRKARIPGFRPGKAPTRVIKQRFKSEILHEVLNDLVPRVLDDALRERGVEAVDTPDVRDVSVEEGQPLTFTASFETVPPFDPGDFSTILLKRPSARVDDTGVDMALQRLRDRAAKFETIEGRGIVDGDTATLDLERYAYEDGGKPAEGAPERPAPTPGMPGVSKDAHTGVNVELGAKANPPGFDVELLGLEVGASKTFSIRYPADYPIGELASTAVSYSVVMKGLKRRKLPELDDEFAKDMGEFESLDALRARARADLEHEARHSSERDVRGQLMKELATRAPFEVPPALVDREVERRVEEFVQRLIGQGIDPRQAAIDWRAFQDSQRGVAREAVAAAMVLDEVARREALAVTEAEVEAEIGRYATQTGRTAAAVRAAFEKEGGLSRVSAGLRREKTIDWVMARATIASE